MTSIDFDAEMRDHSCPDCSFREPDLSGELNCLVCLGGRLKFSCSACGSSGKRVVSQTPAVYPFRARDAARLEWDRRRGL